MCLEDLKEKIKKRRKEKKKKKRKKDRKKNRVAAEPNRVAVERYLKKRE